MSYKKRGRCFLDASTSAEIANDNFTQSHMRLARGEQPSKTVIYKSTGGSGLRVTSRVNGYTQRRRCVYPWRANIFPELLLPVTAVSLRIWHVEGIFEASTSC
jgi:hypothetical protein